MPPIPSQPDDVHPDFELLARLKAAILSKVGGLSSLQSKFPKIVRGALDFVLDPVRTARTRVTELDNVEKTFIGLKLEHFVRDMLDVPKGLRDLVIDGIDVDIKNTVNDNWSIPQETYRSSEPCLLMMVNDDEWKCSLGLIIARPEYLHKGKGNRDTKKGVSAGGRKNIDWLVQQAPFPASLFNGLDMNRFRELRKILAGSERAAQFWRENLGRVLHRDVMQALLFDQYDYMKRLRANGGAPDVLGLEGIAILIGTYRKEQQLAAVLGFDSLKRDEVVGVAPKSQDEWQIMRDAKVIATSRWTA